MEKPEKMESVPQIILTVFSLLLLFLASILSSSIVDFAIKSNTLVFALICIFSVIIIAGILFALAVWRKRRIVAFVIPYALILLAFWRMYAIIEEIVQYCGEVGVVR